jgi:hypothetical protein
MPSDAGVLPDRLDGGLAMDKGPGADVFGAGIEMAFGEGVVPFGKGKPLKESLFSGYCIIYFLGKGQSGKSRRCPFCSAISSLEFEDSIPVRKVAQANCVCLNTDSCMLLSQQKVAST